jgi:hypothetical protein
MSSPDSRWQVALLGSAGALLALLGFGLAFWALLGHGAQTDTRTALAATLGTAWVLAVLYGVHRVARARAEQRHARWAAQQQALAAAREAEAEARHAQLLADPRWAPFHPLIRRWRLSNEAWLLEQEQRHQALLADPRRAHHAPKALEGARWSDAQLDYFDDPQARVTCLHLQPVEGALRAAGLPCWPQGARQLGTVANLHADALRAALRLGPEVQWRDEEEHPHAPPRSFLHCTACTSAIESGNGPGFPAAAPSQPG